MSETARQRHLTARYCTGNGVDLGSGGDPVVPWAIQVELSEPERKQYANGAVLPTSPQWRGDARQLPFKDGTLDFVYSSHLLEDFVDWMPALREWTRVLKPDGYLVLLVPDQALFAKAIAEGQSPNAAHQHEATVGELSCHAPALDLTVLEDRLTQSFPGDYNILFVGRKR